MAIALMEQVEGFYFSDPNEKAHYCRDESPTA